MSKISQSFYSTAVEHKEMPGIFMGSFAIPGDPPLWVTERDGKPKMFRNPLEAELAGFRVMVTRLNKVKDVQEFLTKRERRQGIRSYRAEEKRPEPTVQSVFGTKK